MPERLRRARDGVLEVVQVEERRRAAEQHLGDPRPRAGFDVRLGPVGIDREQRFEKAREVPVVRDPAERGHRDVRMGVHEAGNDRETAAIHNRRALAGGPGSDVGETAALDAQVGPERCVAAGPGSRRARPG